MKRSDDYPLDYHQAQSLPTEDALFTVEVTDAGLHLTVYMITNPAEDPDVRRCAEMFIDSVFGLSILDEFAEAAWREVPLGFAPGEEIYERNELLDVLA